MFAPRLQPRRDLIDQRLAQAGMLDAFDRLAEKGLDQQRFGLRGRNAARHQIEFQFVVERAGGGAVAALHVVGENLELGLVVGFGAIGQQQRLRHHLAVGPLRVPPHDDAALEYAVRLVVEHGLEYFAALAGSGDVIGDQRGIGVLAALEQACAADAGHGALAVEIEKQLIAHHGAAGDEGEGVETRAGADRGRQRRNMKRVGALADDFDVIDMRVVADEQLDAPH